METRFDGRIVVITGASAGIGAAAARAFAARGAQLVLAARGERRLQEMAAEIRSAGGRVLAVPTDVGVLADCKRLIGAASREYGGLDILVNNAGVNPRGHCADHTAEELWQAVLVNVAGPIALCRLALPLLERSVAPAIVNVASLAGRIPLAHEAVYSATKFALRTFSFALGDELEAAGVSVSAVSPGPVDTDMIMADLEGVPDAVLSQRLSSPEQIAALILACAADGRRERVSDRAGGYLTTLGYLLPGLRRRLLPLVEWRGRKNKERYRRRRAVGSDH